jgi:ADP-L-glycero-D-manno-heptose 6-epimerase
MEEDMGYLLENNYRFSKRLAEYCFAHGCRFIYASSAATYGDGSRGFLDDEGGLYDLQSINRYAYSKHLFDLWLSKEGLFNKVAGFKFFNVFGPNEWHKGMMASMIYHMTKTIQKEGEVRLFKSTDIKYQDGEQKRDFIYVKDVVKILGDFLDNDICGIFNLGRGEAVSWNSVASAIFKALGKVENIRYIDMPASLVNGYQNYTCADMSKYFKVVGKHDMWSLDKAIDDYVKNYILMDKLW